MFCGECGNLLPENVKFCPNCGRMVGSTEGGKIQKPGSSGTGGGVKIQKKYLFLVAVAVVAVIVLTVVVVSISKGNSAGKDSYPAEDTIEDLYGTWSDEEGTLSLTFLSDGTVRIADATNLFGADFMEFTELDEDTLRLSVNDSGILGMLSITMDYKIRGKTLWISFLGKEFSMTKN